MDRLRLGYLPRMFAAILVAMAAPPAPYARASERIWQPVVIRGAEVPAMLGARENQIEVLAMRTGVPVPIPFQIDEVIPDGRFALTDGAEPLADDSPGVFDRDDQLVAMISDFGERAPTSASLTSGAIEISVTDPLGGPPRYAYAAVTANPRISTARYIDYSPDRQTFETDSYRLALTNELESDLAMQSARGSTAPNLIDRFKVRAVAKILRLFNFSLNEDEVEKRLVGWHAGPIRVVRSMAHRIRIALGIKAPEVASTDLFYRNLFEAPFLVKFPWVPRALLDDVRVRMDIDFASLDGYTLSWDGMDGAPVTMGVANERAQVAARIRDANVNWFAVRSDRSILIRALAPNPELAALTRRFYFNDDPNSGDAPERVIGEHPGVGFQTTGWERLARGPHSMDVMLAVLPAAYDPAKFHVELAHPVSISAAPAADR
jgi:hypothetical protein